MGPLISFDSDDKRTTYCLDVTAGANIFFHKSGRKQLIMLYPELGYTFEYRGLHLGHLGLGLGTGRLWAGWAYVPRFVIGAEQRNIVVGFRHSLVATYLVGGLWLELSHQILGRESGLKHDLRVLMGFDVPRLLFLIPHLGRALSR